MGISYVIPHYESLISLKKLLKSIELSENDEVLIVDDCSSNKIYDELKNFETKNIRVFRNTKNGGAGKARNLGIRNASKKWLIFADSDDVFVEGYRSILEKHLESKSDIVYFKPTSKKESINKSVIENRHSFYSYLIDKNLKKNNVYTENDLKYKMVVPWSKMVSRQFVKENDIKFDEVKVSNDVMFATRIAFYAKSIRCVNETIYCCVEIESSMTADTSFSKTMDRLDVFNTQYDFLKQNLSKKEFNNLCITGLSYVLLAKRSNYTVSQKKSINFFLKEKNIPLVTKRYIFYKISKFFTEKGA
ncbi:MULTISPECIES: glycosyltransferase family 2 protein [Vagococcus]|uniref:Glycosyl transferase, family 2 n=1 Tax=Vagococcus fluvialis bH819 TaxID=1255619 RepID=A0A1X6WLM6_9ENTE|nr:MULTISPECIES: glycosyltransferase family 2 protein [Vagococcus]SLM85243.1 glycosyl transferase, family 2 [Vagococcus fluvialis bH819]HCM89457.1 glycosyltransferase family 2 protein [Vagococcus sp.]